VEAELEMSEPRESNDEAIEAEELVEVPEIDWDAPTGSELLEARRSFGFRRLSGRRSTDPKDQ
jgi:hypothetical protein